MRVALLSLFWNPIREPFTGGTEVFVHDLAEGLLERGIEVVVYGCKGTRIADVEVRTFGTDPGRVLNPTRLSFMPGFGVAHQRDFEDELFHRIVIDAMEDPSIDLVHNNSFSPVPLYVSKWAPKPVVHTLHSPAGPSALARAVSVMASADTAHICCVSESQRRGWDALPANTPVIWNGVRTDNLPPTEGNSDGSLAFVGRIDPTKGVEDAIEAAHHLEMPLNIFGPVPPHCEDYFHNVVEPLVRGSGIVYYHGHLKRAALYERLRLAQALLFPVKWEEPFGYVLVEAMAIGVPVVSYGRGAAAELIDRGLTGYVVSPDNLEHLIDAVRMTEDLDRIRCSRTAREKFDHRHCLDRYVTLYVDVLSERDQTSCRAVVRDRTSAAHP